MFVLILGAPGSGKGTQGKILAERLQLPKITTGDILRAAVKDGTPLGKDAKKFMDQGQLVPDALILELIKGELTKPEAKDGCRLEGQRKDEIAHDGSPPGVIGHARSTTPTRTPLEDR